MVERFMRTRIVRAARSSFSRLLMRWKMTCRKGDDDDTGGAK